MMVHQSTNLWYVAIACSTAIEWPVSPHLLGLYGTDIEIYVLACRAFERIDDLPGEISDDDLDIYAITLSVSSGVSS
jgi:hypothetical protein